MTVLTGGLKNVPNCYIVFVRNSAERLKIMDASNFKPAASIENASDGSIPPHAFLIMEGVKTILLDVALITLGRSHDNMIVVDDPRVSRHHAEIRAVHGNFMIFDLLSLGGTYVNGRRMNQGILYSGDLISLAGVSFVFTQDTRLVGRGTDPLTAESSGKRDTVPFKKTAASGNDGK